MSTILQIQLLDVAPLLPTSVALIYIASVALGWEQSLARRISGRRTYSDKGTKAFSPANEAGIKAQESSTWTSPIISAAVPIAHHSLTTTKLGSLKESETATTDVCLGQIALILAEFAIHYFRHQDWRRKKLLCLGVAWSAMVLRQQDWMPESGLTDKTSAICVAFLAVLSILPEHSTTGQDLSETPVADMIKDEKEESPNTDSTTSRYSLVHLHIFSAALLLVYLFHDYPSVSSNVLNGTSWLGSFPQFLVAFSLLLLRGGIGTWQATHQQQQTTVQHLRAFVSSAYIGTPELVRCGILIPLSVMGPWLSFFFLTNYMASCLGFRKLIFDKPRTMPGFLDGGIFGGFVYHMVVFVQFFLRRQRIKKDNPDKLFHLIMAFATAFGQTTMGLVILALGLYGQSAYSW